MKFLEGDIITLNNNKDYVILNIVKFDNDTYLNLLGCNESEVKIVKVLSDNGVIVLIENLNNEEIGAVLNNII